MKTNSAESLPHAGANQETGLQDEWPIKVFVKMQKHY